MKPFLYTLIFFSGILYSCSSGRSLSSTIEDDIYYVPGKKSLMVQEVEHLAGNEKSLPQPQKNYSGEKVTSQGSTKTPIINRQKGTVENISTADLLTQAQEQLSAEGSENEMIYYNTGYWIGGFKGSESDLQEVVRIINMYPNGFGFLANGQDIALNLSFDPDWNVYTDNYRYWWFPSSTNIALYSSLLFGTYPKYIWAEAWDNPRFDSWAFNSTFNPRFNIGFNFGWGSPGWGFGFGWGSGYYDPWGYNGWYGYPYYGGWYGGWYNNWWNDPWHHHHYPHWGNNHWGNGHYPNWGPPSGRPSRPGVGQRPNYGGGVTGIRPGNSSRPDGTIRPSYRPNSGVTRPNTGTIRPSGVTRPGSSLRPNGNVTRPDGNITRPNGSITRPNGNVTRPNSGVTRPGSSSVTRPVTRPNQSVTRPGQVVRPNPTAPRPSRPTTSSSSGNVKNYTRPQNNYRPTYNNNNSRPSYNSGNVSRPSYSGSNSNSSRSSYSGSSSSGSSRSSYSGSSSGSSSRSSYSPGSSGGGSSRPSSPAPSRPTRR